MTKRWMAVAVGLGLAACQQGPKDVKLESQNDKVSYAIGLDIGRNFERQGLEVNPDIIAAGMRDALTKAEPKMTDEEMRETMMAFRQEMIAKQTQKAEEASSGNKEAGQKFLEENKTKEGVKTTESGLQYKVLTEGKGKSPGAEDQVKVHYEGKLLDGTVFDSSYKRGEPAVFPVNGLIPGWTEALQLMKPGAKWELYIPADLAYGDRGAGPQIPPGSTLIFTTELIEVMPKK